MKLKVAKRNVVGLVCVRTGALDVFLFVFDL
jgi:hypothetical protein